MGKLAVMARKSESIEIAIPQMAPYAPGPDTLPRYRFVYHRLREAIVGQTDSIGKCLPIEKNIATHFHVSKITVRQALDLLEKDGYIKKIHAKPAVIVSTSPIQASSRHITTVDDLLRNELNLRISVAGWERSSYPFASVLFNRPESEGLHMLSLRQFSSNGQVGYSEVYFPPELGSKLNRDIFEEYARSDRANIFKIIETECGVLTKRIQVTVSAVSDEKISEKIGIEKSKPVICMQMVFWSLDGIFQVTNNWFDGSYYRLSYDLIP